MSRPIPFCDFCTPSEQLAHVDPKDLPPLPPPYDKWEEKPWTPLSQTARTEREATLDDTLAVGVPKPKSKQEEDELVAAFRRGLDKLFTPESNWTFLHPRTLS
ncbi:MAG: (Fe-S)-binding protein, partial [Deltaproteobacteria bacterium]|nr:(Fe-S)-binding protein [Deltaproteobacteria bacterium]